MPDISLLYLDQPLQNVSVEYSNDQLYAERIFPPVPVPYQTGRVPRFWFEHFRVYEDIRARLEESKEIAPWTLDMPSFSTRDHSLKDAIADEDRSNNMLGQDLEVKTVKNLTQAILLRLEVDAKNKCFGVGTVVPGTTLSGTSQWSDYSNSDPIIAVENARVQIKRAISNTPNVMAVSYPVYVQLRNHPLIVDRFKYTHLPTGYPSAEQLRSIFDVDQFWVLGAEYDSSNEGNSVMGSQSFHFPLQSTDSVLSFVWGNNAFLAFIDPSPGKLQPIFGFTARWIFGAPELGGTLVKRYRVESKTADFIEVHRYHDLPVLVPGAMFTWTNAVA
jgi:hypothetical protein